MASPLKRQPRLPGSYRLRLRESEITREYISLSSSAYHPEGRTVSPQFVTQCVLGQEACPAWLHRQLDTMLTQAEKKPDDGS